MTFPEAFTIVVLFCFAYRIISAVWYDIRRSRKSTPREPNPEPGPQGKTPAELKAEIWGDDYEAKANHKIGGLPGLHLERAEIIRRMKREHVEMQMLDPADDGFAAEYDHRMQMKDNYRRQLLALDMMMKGNE